MALNQLLEKEREKSFYVWFEDEEVVISDQDGICVASTDNNKIGLRSLDVSHIKSFPLISLSCRYCQASLVLQDGEAKKSAKEIATFKSLAELTLQQYFKVKEVSKDSIDQFITKLISEQINSSLISQYESEAKALGLNFDQTRVGLIIHFKNFEQRLFLQNHHGVEALELIQRTKREIASAINGFFTKNNDLIIAYVGEGRFLIFKAVEASESEKFQHYLKAAQETIFGPLKTKENGEITVGYGNVHIKLIGLIEAYREANLAFGLGQKMTNRKSPVFYFGDFKELRILAEDDNGKKLIYAQEIIGNLQSTELRRTLETFFDQDLNITNTAIKLSIHPNTVLYRLKKIKDILGLDPKVFEEATAIRIALLTLKFLS